MRIFIVNVLLYIAASSNIISAMQTSRWDAQSYLDNAEVHYGLVEQWIDDITANFKGNETILDIGCGPGTKTYELSQKVPNGSTYGIDSSLDMIQKAQQLYPQSSLRFFHMSAESLAFNQRFHLITSFSCLHWLKEQEVVLKQIKNALYNDGIFLGTAALEHVNLTQFMVVLAKTALQEKWQIYMPKEFLQASTRENFLHNQLFPLNKMRLSCLLQEAGLTLVDTHIIEKQFTFSREKFIQWLKCWIIGFSLLEKIPAAELENFLSDFVDNYLIENNIENETTIHYSTYILLFRAKK